MKLKICLIFILFLFSFGCFNVNDSETSTHYMLVDGRFRSYNIFVPSETNEPLPLVFVLHGAGGNARTAENSFKFNQYAKEKNFIVVYPNGTNILPTALSWNGGICCGYAVQYDVNDVHFFEQLINQLNSHYNIDNDKIFFTGFSNGGYMSHRMACELPQKVNSIASLSGSIGIDECKPNKEISVLIIHGTKDLQVPYYGGVGPAALDGRLDKPTRYGFELWAKNNSCKENIITSESGNILKEKYDNCEKNSIVELNTFFGQDHFWSTNENGIVYFDRQTGEITNISKKIINFFFEEKK